MTFRLPARNQHQHQQQQQGAMAAPARVSVFRRFLVRVTPAERLTTEKEEKQADAAAAAEVGSVALERMVQSFMEEERPPRGQQRCNCFNGGGHQDASDDEEEFDFLPSSSAVPAPAAAGDALELLKGLVQCASAAERALLADASRIVAERCGKQQGGGGGRKSKAEVRRCVAAGLRALGYDAAVCRSRWEAHPAGEHEYIDALLINSKAGTRTTTTRVVVEVDFRAEFEVARPTKAYRAALQALPPLFVGAPDRLGRVVAVVAEAARQSLRKRGLHFPPWRKPEYMRAKWLAPHHRQEPAVSGEVDLMRFGDSNGDAAAEEDAEEKTALVEVEPQLVTGLASLL